MSAFFHRIVARMMRLSALATLATIVALTGCRHPFPARGATCECGAPCGDCDSTGFEHGACGSPCPCASGNCTNGLPCNVCGHLQATCQLPFEPCRCVLQACERSDYFGPIEPPRPPRFYPVPTQPVLAAE